MDLGKIKLVHVIYENITRNNGDFIQCEVENDLNNHGDDNLTKFTLITKITGMDEGRSHAKETQTMVRIVMTIKQKEKGS
jgi:hypothetical protein